MNFEDLKRRFCILGILLVAVSAVFLYLGSKPMPWELQTWGGNSIKEIQFRASRFTQSQVGLLLLAFGSAIQLFYMIKTKDLYWIKKVFNRIIRKTNNNISLRGGKIKK